MDYVRFGRTELKVSVMGLGCGGPSRLGQSKQQSERESIAVVRDALDAGVNFIDTAEAYRTETLVGRAIATVPRDTVVLSTKKSCRGGLTPGQLRQGLEDSLKRLGTDYVDIYNLHGVSPSDYPMLRDLILPEFEKLRQAGKLRFVGVSEMFNEDPSHQMLETSLQEDPWDVVMVGFNILNQSARRSVFRQTRERDVAVQVMFAVRRALANKEHLISTVRELTRRRQLDRSAFELNDPLAFVMRESDASSVVDAAYRFCRYEPGVQVVLSGTGSRGHLKDNIASLEKEPLPEGLTAKLRVLFADVDSVTGQ